MSLRKLLEDWQVRWAERNGIFVGAPPGNPASRVATYVSELKANLFEPLSERVKQQFITGAGSELNRQYPEGVPDNATVVVYRWASAEPQA